MDGLRTGLPLLFVLLPVFARAQTELLFSEYVEGTSNNKALEILVWILIYGGLLLLCLGLFVLRGHASWGWTGVAAER